MSDAVKVGFVPFSAVPRGILVVFCDDALKFGAATRKALGAAADTVKRAAATNRFKGLGHLARKMPFASAGLMTLIGLIIAVQGVRGLWH